MRAIDNLTPTQRDWAYRLRDLMRETSERCFRAGWMNGLEFVCWDAAGHERPGEPWRYGQDAISVLERDELALAHRFCGGWWTWDENDVDGERFVTASEWAAILAEEGR